jgi:hypothetical protein
MSTLLKSMLLLSLGLSTLAQAYNRHGVDGGGGDICQDRIETIRNDISDWIQNGGSAGLNLPASLPLQTYNSSMQSLIAQTRINDQSSISCTNDPSQVVVDGAEKICKSSFNANHNPQILCYRDGFLKESDEDQYFMIHHEFAVLSGFEDQSGSKTDYPLSDQISAFLENQMVKKLSIHKGAVAVPCPVLAGNYADQCVGDSGSGTELAPVLQSQTNGVTTYTESDGSILVADGQTRPNPKGEGNMTVSCSASAHGPALTITYDVINMGQHIVAVEMQYLDSQGNLIDTTTSDGQPLVGPLTCAKKK